jgi:hypothetical protein
VQAIHARGSLKSTDLEEAAPDARHDGGITVGESCVLVDLGRWFRTEAAGVPDLMRVWKATILADAIVLSASRTSNAAVLHLDAAASGLVHRHQTLL